MDTSSLFERYSTAIVSKIITRTDICKLCDIRKQRLMVLEKVRFDTKSLPFYDKLDELLKQKEKEKNEKPDVKD